MRAGGCTLQQGLTAEAASVVKQAVSLARRRGHAQVTPLHVASTMLSASEGLLRTACLQSHSHPLQCRALELCFNVALNRLPASNSSPMLGGTHHHSQHPSISNALIAAFKRAQAHQRRGSIESQQQPLLAVKIELEQLIISILDDPSVSRVMREAGFSSTHVKSNVEQAVSLEICSQSSTVAPSNSATASNTNNNKSKESNDIAINNNLLALSHHQYHQSPPVVNGSKVGSPATTAAWLDPVRSEDVMSVVECLVSKKKKSVVVVGECIVNIEGVVRVVMDKFEKEDVPDGLREVKFIPIPQLLSSSKNFTRVDVEQKIGEVKSLLRTCVAKGVVLYLGDLKWATEYRASGGGDLQNIQQGRGYYCPVEHMIMEIGKLVCEIGENIEGFWLMGIASFQTYMRCKSGRHSLEAIWGIHPLTIPAGSLRLSLLTTQSDLRSDESTSKINGTPKSLVVEATINNGDQYHYNKHDKLTCCAECSAKFDAEARNLQSSNSIDSITSNLPAWLQQCRNESKGLRSSNHDHFQNCVTVSDLYKKWNSYCSSTHQQQEENNHFSEKTLITFSSVSRNSSSASGFTYDHHHHQNPNQDHGFWELSDQNPKRSTINEPSLRMYFPENKENNSIPSSKQPIVLFSPSNPNSNPTSATSSDVMEAEYSHKFKELNSENLKTLCTALERKVPWQKDIIPEIASSILKCRSGMMRRKGKKLFDRAKEETWLLFQGVDTQAKEKIARELARLVFGSHNELVSIALSSFSSTRADSTEDCGRNNGNKRSRDEQSCSYIERFGEAVSSNPHRVFLVEDVEQADYCSQMGFKRAIERGKISNSSGEEVELMDAIIILSCESFSSRSRACSPPIKQKTMDDQYCDPPREEDHDDHDTTSPCLSLDLNISFDDISDEENQSIDDIGLLESVDTRIVFKIQEL